MKMPWLLKLISVRSCEKFVKLYPSPAFTRQIVENRQRCLVPAYLNAPNSFDLLVRLAGIEPATFGFEVPFSHLLACHGRYHSIAPGNA